MPLRLKALELHGYKTFATRTVFEFASGITAIVGPNGAGKSNIADALRWVLGEQSYSLLRGKKTEDMIFSGSEYRPRAGMASAEIVFDNSANWLPLDFSEVSVARRAHRDGRNEYLLNGQHVRLREMNELLASAGLSERTYTIVGQGLVDASLALRADDRRRLFEEAAGVGLYRVRREEAMRRLENTKRNLERVQDIMTEIEPRLKTLERQARKAKEFAAAQADLRSVLREWYGYHWHRAQKDLQEVQENVHLLQGKVQAARDAHEASRTQYSRFRGQLAQTRSQLSSWNRELTALGDERESIELELAVLEERRRAAENSHAALLAEHLNASGEDELARERFHGIEDESARARGEFQEAENQLKVAQRALEARQTGRDSLESELETARGRVSELTLQRTETKARLDALDRTLGFDGSQIAESEQTAKSIEGELNRAEAALEKAMAARQESEANLDKHIAQLEVVKDSLENEEQLRRNLDEQRAGLFSSRSRQQAQVDAIDHAEQTLTGYADGARFLLEAARQSRLKTRGAMSSLMDMPADLETAIASALGDAVDTVLLDVTEIQNALDLLASEPAGRAVLLPLTGRPGQLLSPQSDEEIVGIASQLIKAPADLSGALAVLLGSTLVVRSRAAALRLLPLIPIHGRIVTLQGELFRGDGLITAGRAGAPSTLSRSRQKRELISSLGDLSASLESLEKLIENSTIQVRSSIEKLSTQESLLQAARQQSQQDLITEQKATIEVERQRRVLDWQRRRHEELLQERAYAEKERQRLATLAMEYEVAAEDARSEVRRLTDGLGQLGLEELKEQVAYWSTRAAVSQQTVDSIELRKAERQQAVERTSKTLNELAARADEASSILQQLADAKARLLEQLGGLQLKIEALQKTMEPAEKNLENIGLEETQLEEDETAAQRNSLNAERMLTQFEIDLVRRQEALDSLRARVVDDFGLVSFEYASTVEGPVPLPFEGLVEELPDLEEMSPDLEDQLAQRRARLRRLGLINPEAAKEYEAESERYSFLSAQVQDLHQAEADLRQVISELDELTRLEFSRTYEAVDRQFRAIFSRLFGGGAAHLALTDPENLVETGIEIEARLPGRREQGLSLLSGGERSLTAIALVFALLKVSPTPVCVMDEVDAMLDEANVGRFRDLIKELSQDTQFIIITHNRNTVQAADFIYGVTMGRDSTSQIISLKLDEVSEEMLGTHQT